MKTILGGVDTEASSFFMALLNRGFFLLNLGLFFQNWVNQSLWMLLNIVALFACWYSWKLCDADWRGYAKFLFGYKKVPQGELISLSLAFWRKITLKNLRGKRRRQKRRGRRRRY